MKPTRLLLFAPGAGAPSSSPWMRGWQARLDPLGEVVPFDYPYALAGRKTPDRLPILIDSHRAALVSNRGDRDVVLIGKSMGSRVGCHLALEEKVDALICLGYPLRGMGGRIRDEVLLALETPILFIQGTRDALCPLPLLEEVRARMKAPSALHVVEGGDHSLVLSAAQRKKEAITQDQSDARALAAIARFLDEQSTLKQPIKQ